MFFSLLLVTLVTAGLVSFIAARAFSRPVESILNRLIADEIAGAWVRYMKFAIYVVGISGGVRIHSLERYAIPQPTPRRLPEREAFEAAAEAVKLELTSERWVLEIYRTIIESLQAVAWMLLVFFLVSLGMYVIVRVSEMRRGDSPAKQDPNA